MPKLDEVLKRLEDAEGRVTTLESVAWELKSKVSYHDELIKILKDTIDICKTAMLESSKVQSELISKLLNK